MGQQMSIGKRFHVSLSQYEQIANDTYTVKRTSGELDRGWGLPHQSGLEPNVEGPSATKHCGKDEKQTWRIFMDNGKTIPEEYVGGWRRLETIYPTRFDGDEEAIRIWRRDVLELLEMLEAKRLEAPVE